MTGIVLQGREIALCNTGSGVRAIGGVCPHAGGPLAEGALHGETVVCPWHGWEFSCVTGRNDFDPAVGVATYPVMLKDGLICVDPDAGTA